MLGHHWPASEKPFLWYFDPWSLSPHQLKTLSELDPLLQNFLDPRMVHILYNGCLWNIPDKKETRH